MGKKSEKPSVKVLYPGKNSEDSVHVDGIGEEDGKIYPKIEKNNENTLSVTSNEDVEGMGSTICLEGK